MVPVPVLPDTQASLDSEFGPPDSQGLSPLPSSLTEENTIFGDGELSPSVPSTPPSHPVQSEFSSTLDDPFSVTPDSDYELSLSLPFRPGTPAPPQTPITDKECSSSESQISSTLLERATAVSDRISDALQMLAENCSGGEVVALLQSAREDAELRVAEMLVDELS